MPSSPSSIIHVFVYGTLKRGEERQGLWPFDPVDVSTATIQGTLFDLGDYPAMRPGTDVVVGEVWQFTKNEMPLTLRVLDQIEDYRDSDNDLYKRVVVQCDAGDKSVSAFTYFYATELDESLQVAPADGICRWTAKRIPRGGG